jgi:ParB/RepB/Spo0J family partition protein
MTIERFMLDQIVGNPFQTRLIEDPGQVARVAESIASVGLLQIPVGRWEPGDHGIVQLAFGHTRLAAFRQLAKEDAEAYGEMPVDIRALSDLELFELAVRENLDRKDLSPIEEAKAMATYRDQFSKTSAEIGVLFGLSDSAVRNKMRLLELPGSVQDSVQSGDIQEGAARRLLVLQRIAPQRIEQVARDLVKDKVETSDELVSRVSDVLQNEAFHMATNNYYSRRAEQGEDDGAEEKGRAGTGLWPLSWKGGVQAPTPAAMAKILEAKGWKGYDPKALEAIMGAFVSGTDVAGVVQLFGINEEIAAWIRQFVAPPPCSACDFHQVLDGAHYCGIKACWEQKRKAWIVIETARVSKKLGIPVYDPGADGKVFVKAPHHWQQNDRRALDPAWVKLLKAKDESLRLKGGSPDYEPHAGTSSYVVELVRVGKPAEQAKAAEKRRNRQAGYGGGSYDHEKAMREREEQEKRASASLRFVEQVAAPTFGPMLKGLDSPAVLEVLAEVTSRRFNAAWKKKLPAKRAARCAALHQLIAIDLLHETADYRIRERGPAATAKHLVGVAKTLGVRLPADWAKRAEAFEPAKAKANGKSVSADTDDDEES